MSPQTFASPIQRLFQRGFTVLVASLLGATVCISLGGLACQVVSAAAPDATAGTELRPDGPLRQTLDSAITPAAGPAVDLLAKIEFPRHAVAGIWEFQQGALVGSKGLKGPEAILQFPDAPPEEYDLLLTVQRTAGKESIMLGLVVGGRQCLAIFEGWPFDGYRTGLHVLDGRGLERHQEHVVRGRVLPEGKPAVIGCRVRKAGTMYRVALVCDDRELLQWRGDAARLSLEPFHRPPRRDALFLNVWGDAVARITAAQLVPLTAEQQGAAIVPRPDDAVRPGIRPTDRPATVTEEPATRTWGDDTGAFSVVAELVDVQNGQVRLRKEDGRIITVPLARLCAGDRHYLETWKGTPSVAAAAQRATVASPEPGIQGVPASYFGCCFQITGLVHREVKTVFFNKTIVSYVNCDECFKEIDRQEGYRELHRHSSTSYGRVGTDSPQEPINLSTCGTFTLSTDLAPIARAIVTTKTRHSTPRAFYVVLVASMTPDQAKAVQTLLTRIPGVDGPGSSVEEKVGRIRTRISGHQAVSVSDLVAALQGIGLTVDVSLNPTTLLPREKPASTPPLQPAHAGTTSPATKVAAFGPNHCCLLIVGLVHRPVPEGPGKRTRFWPCDACRQAMLQDNACHALRSCVTGATAYAQGADSVEEPIRFFPPGFPLNTDLAPIARAVTTAKTPHPTPRGLYLILGASLDPTQEKAAKALLAATPGVDARGSSVDAKGQRIRVQISGQRSICVSDLVAAFQEAGIVVKVDVPW